MKPEINKFKVQADEDVTISLVSNEHDSFLSLMSPSRIHDIFCNVVILFPFSRTSISFQNVELHVRWAFADL